jgi:hypothetical protein
VEWWFKPKETASGPRLQIAGIKAEPKEGYYYPEIEFYNLTDIAATSYFITGTVFVTDLKAAHVKEAVKNAEDKAKSVTLRTNEELQITRGMGVSLKTPPIPAQDVELVKSGVKKMYLVVIAIYSNLAEPINSEWVTEVCAEVTVPFNQFESCPTHNGYFQADRQVN